MKCNQFEEGEIPYGALEKFGLSHEMIEDLPMHVLEDIWNGRQSPVLPIHVTDDEGELIKSRTRFSLVRMEDGKVDVMFYPVLKYALLEQFDDNQQQLLKDGKAVVADVTSPQGTIIKAFVQIDPETNQVMNVLRQLLVATCKSFPKSWALAVQRSRRCRMASLSLL